MQKLDIPLKIVHQGIDTLVIGCKCTDQTAYIKTFKPFVQKVKDLKEEAKQISTFGNKFVKSTLDLGLGNFLVSSSGKSNYFGFVKNEDIFFYVADVPLDTKINYHIKLQFSSSFLNKVGHKKAYSMAQILIGRILGDFSVKVLRVDLCADLVGINYTQSDTISFRSQKKKSTYNDIYVLNEPNLKNHKTSEYLRYNKFEGIQFGKTPHMLRIYDKTKQILGKINFFYLLDIWKQNGYDFDKNAPVYRHEVEFGREFLKTIFPPRANEIDYLFSNLSSFWLNGINIAEWIHLTAEEREKISTQAVKAESVTKIYQRAKKDKKRFSHWDTLQKWHDTKGFNLEKVHVLKQANFIHCERALKAFVSSVFTHVGTNPENLSYVVDEVVRKMHNEGTSLHDYALSRLASSFVENHKKIEKIGLNMQNDFEIHAKQAIDSFKKSLQTIDEPKYKAPIEKALEIFYGK